MLAGQTDTTSSAATSGNKKEGFQSKPLDREKLENEKLKLEVEQLKDAPRNARITHRIAFFSACMSALTAFIIWGVGTEISHSGQKIADREHENDVFEKLAERLGSNDAPTRAGALIGLQTFAQTPATNSEEDRAPQTLELLSMQLENDRDPFIIRLLVNEFVRIGPPALNYVANANRDAVIRFRTLIRWLINSQIARSSFMRVGTSSPDWENDDEIKNALIGKEKSIFESRLSQLEDAFNRNLMQGNEPSAFPDGKYRTLLESMIFGEDGTSFFQDWRNVPDQVGQSSPYYSSPDELLRDATDQLRVVYVSGLIIARIVREYKLPHGVYDLRDIRLLGTDLDRADLEGVNLSRAFISGTAESAKFDGSDFYAADLYNLDGGGARFEYVRINATQLPYKIDGADFKGANWWDASRIRPGWIENHFPKKENMQQARIWWCNKQHDFLASQFEVRSSRTPSGRSFCHT